MYCMRQFIDEHSTSAEQLRKTRQGFTFSYPVTQTSIKSGIPQIWTKGFDIRGVEGHDTVADLQKVLR